MKLAAIELAELAAVTLELEPARICTDCGHRADDHYIDRKVLLPSQRPGGSGYLHGWSGTRRGCCCDEFSV